MKLLNYIFNPSWVKYAVGLLLFVVPVYPKFPILEVSGIYVSIRLEDFLILILMAVWIIYKLKTESYKYFTKNSFLIIFLLFWGVGLLSTLAGSYLIHIVDIKIGLLHWFRRVEYMSVFFIAYDAVKSRKRLPYYIEVITFVVLIAFLYGLGQMYLNWPVISTQNEEYSKGGSLFWTSGARLHSTFAGHYDLAGFIVLVFPFLLGYFFVLKKFFSKLLLLFCVMFPAFWLLMQTTSRVSFISFLVSGIVCLWLIRKRIFIIPFLLLSIIGSLLISDTGSRFKFFIDLYTKPAQRLFKSEIIPKAHAQKTLIEKSADTPQPLVEDRSIEIRLNQEWPRSLRAFEKNPLIGTGYSSLSLATDNDYLRMLGETGIIGALSFLLILSTLFTTCLLKFKSWSEKTVTIEKIIVAGFIGGLLGLMVNATFIDVFEASKIAMIFWILAGLAIGVVNSDDKKFN